MVIDILLFWIALLLDPQGFDPVASGASTSQRDLDLYVFIGGFRAQRNGNAV
jgi:hypothetical protein